MAKFKNFRIESVQLVPEVIEDATKSRQDQLSAIFPAWAEDVQSDEFKNWAMQQLPIFGALIYQTNEVAISAAVMEKYYADKGCVDGGATYH